MGFWVLLVLVLAFLWVLQAIGTYFQMAHYRKVLSGITAEGGEGYVGVGNAKAYFGKGVILILVAGEDGLVRKALRMRGRTVFARFAEAEGLVGREIDDLRDAGREDLEDPATMTAARMAVEQIDRIRSEKARAAVS